MEMSSTNPNIKGLEKTFRIDVFLLFFLRDNYKAYKFLEKQLSSIGCTVELNFDEEEVLVRGEVDKGPGGGFGGAAEKWECQVDRVFVQLTETYLCYHVLEPKQLKMVLQDSAFKTDDIKVYTERKSVQALGNGLKKCLELCVQQNLCSVAIPIIGPGVILKYPLREAIQVLTDVIHQFGLSASSGSITNIHIVIKPGYPDSEECYHDVYKQLSLIMNQGGQAIFRSLTSDLDDIIMTVGSGVKLHVVFGDITNETTDVVVNTTNFKSFDLGR
ncbi:uncharacterized protein LOC106632688 [Haplochromis burtoni]|uniref:uncharacterized protein LOC106632688 n=1 Tax=Haplochromis burtoni TaxID=8153 RepID=UPI001C2D93EF|nr:uncharacterized protein LOC106632688 [Haplochromis burtoni]